MKEIIIKVPEDAVEFVQEFVERIGGDVVEDKSKSEKKQRTSVKSVTPKLSDIFGSWPDIDLDPKTYRKKLWGKRVDTW